MDYVCYNDIKDKYNLFLDSALSLSDTIVFHIPHEEVLSPDSLKMREEYYRGHPEEKVEETSVDYAYYDRMKNLIQPIEEAIIRKENDFSYLGYGYGYLCESFFIDARHPKVRQAGQGTVLCPRMKRDGGRFYVPECKTK